MALFRITATAFANVARRLGLIPPPQVPYEISNIVIPVALVDSDITLAATASTALLGTPASTGNQTAVAADTVLADTGALAAGDYNVTVSAGQHVTLGNQHFLKLQRRDAANAANVWEINLPVGTSGGGPLRAYFFNFRCALFGSERLRLVTGDAVPAVEVVQGNIWATI